MWLQRKLSTLRSMRVGDLVMVLEAVVLLALARIVVLTVPFRHMQPWLSRQTHSRQTLSRQTPGDDAAATEGDAALLLRVRQAVTVAARNVPWNAVCLPQAMAAKAMLARRNCRSTFHLGAGLDASGKLIAHAWLTVGATVVVGASGIPAVTPLAKFG